MHDHAGWKLNVKTGRLDLLRVSTVCPNTTVTEHKFEPYPTNKRVVDPEFPSPKRARKTEANVDIDILLGQCHGMA